MGLSEKLSVSSVSSFMVEPHCVNEMLYQTELITQSCNLKLPIHKYLLLMSRIIYYFMRII